MSFRKDLGPNSFVLAFEANTSALTALGDLHDAITEQRDGVPRYGYEAGGLFDTRNIVATNVLKSYMLKGKAVDGSDKFITLTCRVASGTVNMTVGSTWSASDGQSLVVARYAFTRPDLNPLWVVPKGRFQVFVFAHRDWLLIVPRADEAVNTAPNIKAGGMGVFNVKPSVNPAANLPKFIVTHTALISNLAEQTFTNWIYPVERFSSFLFPASRDVFNTNEFYSDEVWTQKGNYFLTNFGLIQPIKTIGGANDKDLDAVMAQYPNDNNAVTLRGRTNLGSRDAVRVETFEFTVCGLKVCKPNDLNFLDAVTVKCDADHNLNTDTGQDKMHFVVEGNSDIFTIISGITPGYVPGPKCIYLIPA